MIRTRKFSITQKEYFNLIVELRLKKHMWFIILICLLSIYGFVNLSGGLFMVFMAIYPIVYLLMLYIQLYRWAYSKENKIVFVPRQLTIDNHKISAQVGDDSVFETITTSEISFDYVTRKKELKNYWVLYISKGQFVLIPKSSFNSPDDELEFRKIVSRFKS